MFKVEKTPDKCIIIGGAEINLDKETNALQGLAFSLWYGNENGSRFDVLGNEIPYEEFTNKQKQEALARYFSDFIKNQARNGFREYQEYLREKEQPPSEELDF